MKRDINTKQVNSTFVKEHNGMVPTFITTCDCGYENIWMTTGVWIHTIICKKCNKINVICERLHNE